MLSAGTAVASSTGAYVTYLVADMLKKATGGIDVPIPFVGNLNVADTLKTGVLGYGLLNSIGPLITSLTSGGSGFSQGLDGLKFGGTTWTAGKGYTPTSRGAVSSERSVSIEYQTGSSDDMKQSLAQQAKKEAEVVTGDEPSDLKIIRESTSDGGDTVLTMLRAILAQLSNTLKVDLVSHYLTGL